MQVGNWWLVGRLVVGRVVGRVMVGDCCLVGRLVVGWQVDG